MDYPGWQFNWLKFPLEKPLEFWLEFNPKVKPIFRSIAIQLELIKSPEFWLEFWLEMPPLKGDMYQQPKRSDLIMGRDLLRRNCRVSYLQG